MKEDDIVILVRLETNGIAHERCINTSTGEQPAEEIMKMLDDADLILMMEKLKDRYKNNTGDE